MPDQSEEMTGLEFKVFTVREILEGESDRRGLQSWFRNQIIERTGWAPGKASVHRWLTEGAEPRDPRALEVLDALQEEARRELQRQLDSLP